jgi:hypothetical protein
MRNRGSASAPPYRLLDRKEWRQLIEQLIRHPCICHLGSLQRFVWTLKGSAKMLCQIRFCEGLLVSLLSFEEVADHRADTVRHLRGQPDQRCDFGATGRKSKAICGGSGLGASTRDWPSFGFAYVACCSGPAPVVRREVLRCSRAGSQDHPRDHPPARKQLVRDGRRRGRKTRRRHRRSEPKQLVLQFPYKIDGEPPCSECMLAEGYLL